MNGDGSRLEMRGRARNLAQLSLAVVTALLLLACVADSPPDAARGAALFRGRATCATCHGPDLRGTPMGPPLLDARYAPSRTPDAAIRTAVRDGVEPKNWTLGAMPPLTHLSGSEVDDIIEFVRREQRAVGVD